MRHLIAVVTLSILLTSPSVAQEKVVYIRAGHVVDVTAGRILAEQVLVVRGELLSEIGSLADIRVPEGAETIDLSHATILPGLIDAHVHLTANPRLHGYGSLQWSAMRQAVYGTRAAKLTLDAGFTTVRNLGAAQYGDVAVRDAINEGELAGPRILVSGPALGITGGHCDNNLLPADFDHQAGGVADGPWAIRRQVRENVKYGADVIKFCATGGVLSKGTRLGAQQYTMEEMKALVDEAHTLGLKVAAHAHGTRGIKTAIRAGVDSVEHASILDDEAIELALENGTFLVMDVYVSDFILESGAEAGILEESLNKEKEVGQQQRDSFRRAHEAGVKIAFGSDAGVYPHGLNGRQFAYMVRQGMSPMEALQSATVRAAELLGLADKVGSLSAGRYADIIAVEGNPIDDIQVMERIGFVMKGGEVYVDELIR